MTAPKPGERTLVDAVVPSGRSVSSFGTGEDAARRVRADQRLCWERGQRVYVEDYLRWAPHLADDTGLLLDLIYSEFLILEESGEKPDPEAFVGRFPQLTEPLRKQFQLHHLLDDGTLTEDAIDAPSRSTTEESDRTVLSLTADDPDVTNVDPVDNDADATNVDSSMEDESDRTILADLPWDDLVEPVPPDLGPASTPEVPIVARLSASDTAQQPQRRAALSKIKSVLLTWPGGEVRTGERGTGMAVIPGYEILGELGRGAVGVVYKARQRGLNRLVALKMILAGSHASRQTLARFRAEAEAVARLKHPNIVQVYDIGESEGLPYFSLEYCPGGPLSNYLEGTPLPDDEAARIIETMARAMHYAHQNGIVHRDLKPANVLIAGECDLRSGKRESAPQRSGEWASMSDATTIAGLKIADFGLAKRLDESSQTKTGAVLGTPSYMAPEQASGHIHGITPLADVYALGAILYELLTGRPPFRAATAIDTVVQVLNDEPVPPRRLQSRIPADLETITLRCLEKDKAKRYESAEALADDLGRFLKREPILARPVGPVGRSWRWCRRNPVVASLIGLAVVLLVGGTTVSLFFAQAARAQKVVAEASAETARRNLYVAQMNLVRRAWQEVQMVRLNALLDNHRPEPGGEDRRGFEWHYWDRKAHAHLAACEGHHGEVQAVAYSADGHTLVTGGKDCTVRLWSAANGGWRKTFIGHSGKVVGVAFLPDGRLASAAAVKEVAEQVEHYVTELFVWDVATGEVVARNRASIDDLSGFAASADGKRLATASAEGVIVWDAATGKELLRPDDHAGPAMAVAFAADGRLAAGYGTGTVRLWAEGGAKLAEFGKADSVAQSICFSPDGGKLFVGGGLPDHEDPELSRDGILRLWELKTQELLWTVTSTTTAHFGRIFATGFSPDGRHVYTASDDATLRTWDVKNGNEKAMLQGHGRPINALAVDPLGRCVATASDDDTARVWDAQPWPEPAYSPPVPADPQVEARPELRAFAFLPDGRVVVAGVTKSRDGDKLLPWLQARDAVSGRPLKHFHGLADAPMAIAATADGGRIGVLGGDGAVQVFDTRTGHLEGELPERDASHRGLTFLPDGRLLLFGEKKVVAWKAPAGETTVLREEGEGNRRIRAVRGFDGGRILLAVTNLKSVTVERLDATSGVIELVGHTNNVNVVAFGPDGRTVATASLDRTARLWDATTGRELHVLRGHTSGVESLAFEPSGRRLATGSVGYDLSTRLWDTRTGQEVLTLDGSVALAFSPDGEWLGGVRGGLLVWDGRPTTPERSAQREAIQVVRFLARQFAEVDAARSWLTNDPPLRPEVRAEALALVALWFRDMR